jgi:hypothetical protein
MPANIPVYNRDGAVLVCVPKYAGNSTATDDVLTTVSVVSHSKQTIFFLFGLWGYWPWGHSWPIVPASGDSEDDCGEADGM